MDLFLNKKLLTKVLGSAVRVKQRRGVAFDAWKWAVVADVDEAGVGNQISRGAAAAVPALHQRVCTGHHAPPDTVSEAQSRRHDTVHRRHGTGVTYAGPETGSLAAADVCWRRGRPGSIAPLTHTYTARGRGHG